MMRTVAANEDYSREAAADVAPTVWHDTLIAHAITDPQVKYTVTDDELYPALDTNDQLFATVRDGIGSAVLPGRDEKFIRVEFGIAKITGEGFDPHAVPRLHHPPTARPTIADFQLTRVLADQKAHAPPQAIGDLGQDRQGGHHLTSLDLLDRADRNPTALSEFLQRPARFLACRAHPFRKNSFSGGLILRHSERFGAQLLFPMRV
jgi:hypothetical protein